MTWHPPGGAGAPDADDSQSGLAGAGPGVPAAQGSTPPDAGPRPAPETAADEPATGPTPAAPVRGPAATAPPWAAPPGGPQAQGWGPGGQGWGPGGQGWGPHGSAPQGWGPYAAPAGRPALLYAPAGVPRTGWRRPVVLVPLVLVLVAALGSVTALLEVRSIRRSTAALPRPRAAVPTLPDPLPSPAPTPTASPTSPFTLPSPAPSSAPPARPPATAPQAGVPPLPAGVPGPESNGVGVFATDDGRWNVKVGSTTLDFLVLATDEGHTCPRSLFAATQPASCQGYDRTLAASPDGRFLADAVLVNAGSVAAATALRDDKQVQVAQQAGGGRPIATLRHQVPNTRWVMLATARQVQGPPADLEAARPLLEGLRVVGEDPVLATLFGAPGPS